jgi:hypothetical protein
MALIKEDINDDRYVAMKAKFDSKCRECRADIYKGDDILYDTKEKKVYCVECGRDL